MALGRMPSVRLVSGQQLGVSSDDEPRGSSRGSSTPGGFSTSFLPGLIGFSSDLWVLSLLDFKSFLRSDLFRVYAEDRSPEWSFTGKMRYLILYLITCGDDACGPSPSSSWDVKLLWAEPAGAYEFNADPRP
ncbi:hypothetical protein Bca52824_039422 [Brassica carinata]|uniref:Uncharacterized protein n=1 Tax=Brassica carinata TaxID=52824 RepID=A0A8X7RRL4_BRACI|nr:hypothetical protein Bca52824_039422 [Brassica carinata]